MEVLHRPEHALALRNDLGILRAEGGVHEDPDDLYGALRVRHGSHELGGEVIRDELREARVVDVIRLPPTLAPSSRDLASAATAKELVIEPRAIDEHHHFGRHQCHQLPTADCGRLDPIRSRRAPLSR